MANRSRYNYSQRAYSQRAKQMTGVHLAAYFGLREATMELLKNGHDPDSKDDGRTLLLWATVHEHEGVVKLLLDKGAELESKEKIHGRTPLSWAAEIGPEAVVKLLLEGGAEMESKDKDGLTPLSFAAEKGW
jgi:ankyrin repeat protein